MQDKSFDLGDAFYGKQDVLRCLLETGRKVATHPGAKGDGSELHWKEMLLGASTQPIYGVTRICSGLSWHA